MINDIDVKIREAILDDWYNVYRWYYYSDISPFLIALEGINKESIPSFEDFQKDYEKFFFDGSSKEKGQSFIITLDGSDIGHISYTSYHLKPGISEFDIWLSSMEFTGKGIGLKGVVQLANLMFESGYEKIIMRPSNKNIPAIKSYKKAGFKIEKPDLERYYKQHFISLYGEGDYGAGNDVFMVLSKSYFSKN